MVADEKVDEKKAIHQEDDKEANFEYYEANVREQPGDNKEEANQQEEDKPASFDYYKGNVEEQMAEDKVENDMKAIQHEEDKPASFNYYEGKVEEQEAGGCRQGALRLVGGMSQNEGRVEICNGGQFGTVCDDIWDYADAMVVCRQLGLPTSGAVQAVSRAGFGQGTGPIFLDNVQCRGNETRLLSCLANPIGSHNCAHSEDAGVRCLDIVDAGCTHGDIRLVGGQNSSEGRVEFCNRGSWGTVCDDLWGASDARVVCNQLGLPSSGAVAVLRAGFGAGSGPIWLDNVACRGLEPRLLNCPANQIGSHNCVHVEDAGVRCVPQ